jgi:HYR domain/Bacterial Ig-like domain (group 2)
MMTGALVRSTGEIDNAIPGTPYTVSASKSGCTSAASSSFTRSSGPLSPPQTPLISTTSATCSAPSIHRISNYNSNFTYTFTPDGPSIQSSKIIVGVGALINNATVGTAYTVTANRVGCDPSTASESFIPAAKLASPVVSITGASTICTGTTTTLSPTTDGTWTSSNPSVATVTDAGGVTGISAGTARFTFTQTSTGCQSTTPLVTVGDTEKPTITCPPSQTIALGSFECSRVVVFSDPSVSDNCASPTVERTDAFKTSLKSGSSFGAGTYPLSYRATDAAGNFADCNFTIQVNGQSTSGRLTCIPTLTVALDERQCTNTIDAAGLLIDNTYYCASSYSASIAGRTNTTLSSADIGKTFTVTVGDNSNNNCSTVVTVVDNRAPVLNAPLDASISCTDVSRDGRILTTLSQPTIVYECGRTTFTTQDRAINLPAGQTSFNTRPDGFPTDKNFDFTSAFNANRIIVRTYIATDESNNSSSVQQIIYVKNIELSHVRKVGSARISKVQERH